MVREIMRKVTMIGLSFLLTFALQSSFISRLMEYKAVEQAKVETVNVEKIVIAEPTKVLTGKEDFEDKRTGMRVVKNLKTIAVVIREPIERFIGTEDAMSAANVTPSRVRLLTSTAQAIVESVEQVALAVEEPTAAPEAVTTSIVELVAIESKWTTAGLNLRTEATAESAKTGTVGKGLKIEILKHMDNGWEMIRVGERVGYVNNYYLTSSNPADKEKTVTASRGGTEVTFTLTFYTDLLEENGGYNKTASGASLAYGMVANNKLPFGTKIYLNGYGHMTVMDRGGKNFNSNTRLDVFIPIKEGESRSEYRKRVMNMGVQKVVGRMN